MVEPKKAGRSPDKDGLTRQMRGAVEHFLLHNNELNAYKEHYNCSRMKPGTIRRKADELFANPKMRAVIQRERQNLRDRHADITDRIVDEHAKLAFSNVTDVVQYRRTAEGRYVMSMTTFDELPNEVKAAIKKVKIKTRIVPAFDDGGEMCVQEVQEIEVEMYDKQKSLDSLAKLNGMFIDKHHIKAEVEHKHVVFNIDLSGNGSRNNANGG